MQSLCGRVGHAVLTRRQLEGDSAASKVMSKTSAVGSLY